MWTIISTILLMQNISTAPTSSHNSNEEDSILTNLIQQAEFYGMNCNCDNPEFITIFDKFIRNFASENSVQTEEEAENTIINEIIPDFNNLLNTHDFPGWNIDKVWLEKSAAEKKNQIQEALLKIFEFAGCRPYDPALMNFQPEKMVSLFRCLSKSSLSFNGEPVSLDTALIYLSGHCDIVSSCVEESRSTYLLSLVRKVLNAAEFFLSNFDRMITDVNPNIETETEAISDEKLSAQERKSKVSKRKISNFFDRHLYNQASFFMHEYRLEHQEMQNDWAQIFSFSKFSDERKKIYVENLRIRYSILKNLKSAMMLFYNASRFLKNEKTLYKFELNFKCLQDDDDELATQSKDTSKLDMFDCNETDFENLLVDQLLSLLSYRTINIEQ